MAALGTLPPRKIVVLYDNGELLDNQENLSELALEQSADIDVPVDKIFFVSSSTEDRVTRKRSLVDQCVQYAIQINADRNPDDIRNAFNAAIVIVHVRDACTADAWDQIRDHLSLDTDKSLYYVFCGTGIRGNSFVSNFKHNRIPAVTLITLLHLLM